MTGPNLNGKYSICRVEMQTDSDGLNFATVRWGYRSEEEAVAALRKVAQEESMPLADLAVVGVVFAEDIARDRS